MNDDLEPDLAGQRIRLRALLAAQREQIARQMAATHLKGSYPRSQTLRWVMHKPWLLTVAVGAVVGRRAALAVPIALSAARLLRTYSDARKAPPPG